jgi:hypothetical protein
MFEGMTQHIATPLELGGQFLPVQDPRSQLLFCPAFDGVLAHRSLHGGAANSDDWRDRCFPPASPVTVRRFARVESLRAEVVSALVG